MVIARKSGRAFRRSGRSGAKAERGFGCFTLSGMTLRTSNRTVPPESESVRPSGASRHNGGSVIARGPVTQTTTGYRITHPRGDRSTAASPSDPTSSASSSFPARTRHPSGTLTCRASHTVSPTVGRDGDTDHGPA